METDKLAAEFFKRHLIGTRIGLGLLELRDRYDLVKTGKRHFEEVGSLANDYLCRKLMVRMNQAGKTFLDVGAHLGSVASAVRHYNPNTHVLAFEAMPDKAENLRNRFKWLQVENCAVGNFDGTTEFFVNVEQSGYSSLNNSLMPDGQRATRLQLPIRKLDSVSLPKNVDAMKIDVEGAEQGVIMGAEQLLMLQRPIIYFESGPGDLTAMNFTKTGLWKSLADCDYTIHVPHRAAHADPGLSIELFIDSHDYPRRTTNYIAIPKDRRTEYRDRVRKFLNF
jgi:FkbM family methyltransferase